ncbi:MAG: hypothetical protein PHS37_03710 [Candidatus Omnitrophica bacterium]|nr:hypothetical protein [Candidatus Omnitrophota bacterium]
MADETPKPQTTPEPAVADDVKKTDAAKPAAAPTAAKPAPVEKAANCPVCNKSMKKKWYYRNGNYYCCRGCFKQSVKKAAEGKEPAKDEKSA